MAITNLLPSNIPNELSFCNLALFICHLFTDAKFRSIHILYESNAFDYQLLTEIASVCPHSIPLYVTDISQPFELPWPPTERTDSNLQLIFFSSERATENMNIFRDSFIFYRIFVFALSDNTNGIDVQYKIVEKFNPGYSSNTLMLHHNMKNDSIFINWMPINDNDIEYPRPVNKVSALALAESKKIDVVKYGNLYDETFGKYDGKRSITINLHIVEAQEDDDGDQLSNANEKYVIFLRSAFVILITKD